MHFEGRARHTHKKRFHMFNDCVTLCAIDTLNITHLLPTIHRTTAVHIHNSRAQRTKTKKNILNALLHFLMTIASETLSECTSWSFKEGSRSRLPLHILQRIPQIQISSSHNSMLQWFTANNVRIHNFVFYYSHHMVNQPFQHMRQHLGFAPFTLQAYHSLYCKLVSGQSHHPVGPMPQSHGPSATISTNK